MANDFDFDLFIAFEKERKAFDFGIGIRQNFVGIEVEEEDDDKKKQSKEEPKKQKKAPPANPASHEEGEEYDAEYIRNLDPRSKEYAEFRKKLGLR